MEQERGEGRGCLAAGDRGKSDGNTGAVGHLLLLTEQLPPSKQGTL